MEVSSSQILSTPSKNPSSSLLSETGALNLNVIKTQSPSRKLQQAFFEEGLILEAEERAARVHSHTYQFSHQSIEVRNTSPKILYNARGNPYEEGDPNMGYSPRSLQPRYSQSHVNAVDNPSSTRPVDLDSIRANPDRGFTTSPPREPLSKTHSQTLPQQTNLKLVEVRVNRNLSLKTGLHYYSHRVRQWI